jgi:hypothetical protein
MDKKYRTIALIATGLILGCATLQSRESGFVRINCPSGSLLRGVDRDELWCETKSGSRVGPHANWEGGLYLFQYSETDQSGALDGYKIQLIDGTPARCGAYEHGAPCGEHFAYRFDSSVKGHETFPNCTRVHVFPLVRWGTCAELAGAGAPL